MGMFILAWFIKAPDWKQQSDLLMTEGWTNCRISTAWDKEKRSKFQKVPHRVVSPDMRRKHHSHGEQIGEREGGDKEVCGVTGATRMILVVMEALWCLLWRQHLVREFYYSFPAGTTGGRKGNQGTGERVCGSVNTCCLLTLCNLQHLKMKNLFRTILLADNPGASSTWLRSLQIQQNVKSET